MPFPCLCAVANGQAFDRSSEHLVATQLKRKLPPSRRDGDVRCVTSLANGNEPMNTVGSHRLGCERAL